MSDPGVYVCICVRNRYSKDYPVLPFIPRSWGGVAASPGLCGVNVSSDGVLSTFSGPRVLPPAVNASSRHSFSSDDGSDGQDGDDVNTFLWDMVSCLYVDMSICVYVCV